jgi:hypothetical protein
MNRIDTHSNGLPVNGCYRSNRAAKTPRTLPASSDSPQPNAAPAGHPVSIQHTAKTDSLRILLRKAGSMRTHQDQMLQDVNHLLNMNRGTRIYKHNGS